MPGSLLRAIVPIAVAVALACRRPPPPEPAPLPAPPLPPVSGALVVEGLDAPVTITRDGAGVPHIVARNQDDLFFAQGFVQAQDRLFQIDLWRRSAQGRLAEVLGANFIERDAMTRRMQFRGDVGAEWASYGPDAKAIATAFTRGINAWITSTRDRLPEEFALAGWTPEPWVPEDLLNRTDGFLASSGADDELYLGRLSSAVSIGRAARLVGLAGPPPSTSVDLKAINYFVGDVLKRVGTAPFFLGLSGPVPGRLRPGVPEPPKPLPLPVPPVVGVAFGVGPSRTATRAALVAGAVTGGLETPSIRYLVHLQAPGWNVIGATAPWRPGVAIGHNDRVAWTFVPAPLDTQDIVVERLNPANPRQIAVPGGWRDLSIVPESVSVKGRKQPYVFEKQFTPRGVVVAVDRERHLVYTLRWSGSGPGGAAELGALSIGRARSSTGFRQALANWGMPVAEFTYADVDGQLGRQVAGLVPARRPGGGALPAAGWTREADWGPTRTVEQLPGVVGASAVASAPGHAGRLRRVTDRLAGESAMTAEGAWLVLRDTFAWNASRLVPLLTPLKATDPVVEDARQRLVGWDRKVAPESPDALLYAVWEHALLRRLGSLRIPSALLDGFMPRGGRVLVAAVTQPTADWFDGDPVRARNSLLLDALTAAIDDERRWTAPVTAQPSWGQFHQLAFRHPLAISPEARRRYEMGPFPMGGYDGTILATVRGPDRTIGPVVEFAFDTRDWDQSRVVLAPGQSAAPDSPHFGDQADRWVSGRSTVLRFTDAGVAGDAETRLTLVPPP